MAYATLMHFMTQLFRWSLSSLGGAPFVWQVRFRFFFLWKFLVIWVLVMEIDVVEPQELRQSPNVEKSMGIIVS